MDDTIMSVGSFIFLNILAFGFMGYGVSRRLPLAEYLHFGSMVVFFIIGLYMIGPYEIATIMEPQGSEMHYNATGQLILNVTSPPIKQVYIEDTVTDGIAWVYWGLGFFSLILFVMLRAQNSGTVD